MLRTELWHAALSHFPIAFLATAAMIYPLVLFLSTRNIQASAYFFVYRFLLYGGTAFTALNLFVGDEAATIVGMGICDRELLYRHEDFAHYLLILSSLITVLDIFYLGLRERFDAKLKIAMAVTCLMLNFGNLYFLVLTSHYGGELVYEQGAAVKNAVCQ